MSPQSSIAHYRIVGKLGEGGMGAVYRATDTKLNRDVAIKVLPEEFSQDAARMARFAREAQVLASLNHPNIAAIYGIEQSAIVMELVEGEELRGPLSEEQALPLIHQLIDALEYAHEKGVVHRDLKPANLKITPEGKVKVLDFGLAKAMSGESPAAGNPTSSPTLTMRATMAGTIMGTVAYMAPEQARGQNVDKRADIWSFGVVVYELLTGKQLFTGDTIGDTLAAVLKSDPDLSPVPPRFHRLLRLCLTRDARRRLRDIGDARVLLEAAPAASATGTSPRLPWIVAALALASAIVFAFLFFRQSGKTSLPLTRFPIELPGAIDGPRMTALLSPEGRRILYRVMTPNGATLAIRALDQPEGQVLNGTDRDLDAFFSADGAWIGFFGAGKLKKIPVTGGPVTVLADATAGYGATWLPDGSIVAVLTGQTLARLPASGGSPQRLMQKLELDRYPQALPGDAQILFTAAPSGTTNFDDANLDVLSLATGQRKTVLHGGYFGRYVPSGHILYVHGDAIYAVRFNLSRLETQGAPVPMLQGASVHAGIGAGHFDVSRNGTLLYVTGRSYTTDQSIGLIESSGERRTIPGLAGESVRLSPDGKRLARAEKSDIFVYDFARDVSTRITFDPKALNRSPIWSPDGRHLAYSGPGGIWWTRSDGSGQPVRILERESTPMPWSMTADGPRRVRLFFHWQTGEELQRDIYALPLDLADPDHPSAGQPEPYLTSQVHEIDPMISPDGHWMAYCSEDAAGNSNTASVFVRAYRPGAAASGGQWQLGGPGGRMPVWDPAGKQIFFRSATGRIMVADYTVSGDTFIAGKPREWSRWTVWLTETTQDFDIFPDGRRAVVLNIPLEDTGAIPGHVNVVFNLFDELKRRLP